MTTNFTQERKIVEAVWNRKALWAIHLGVNALIVGLVYQWLWIPDQTILYLALSLFSGAALIALILWLHGSTLAHFRAVHLRNERQWTPAFRPSVAAIARLFALVTWAVLPALLIGLVLYLGRYEEDLSIWAASFLSFRLRRPITPAGVSLVYAWSLTALGLFVIPAMLLPLGSRVAEVGFHGFTWSNIRRSLKTLRRTRYWIACMLLFIFGAVIPFRLVWWIPKFNGLFLESASIGVRFVTAYVLAVTSWLMLASVIGSWSRNEDSN